MCGRIADEMLSSRDSDTSLNTRQQLALKVGYFSSFDDGAGSSV